MKLIKIEKKEQNKSKSYYTPNINYQKILIEFEQEILLHLAY